MNNWKETTLGEAAELAKDQWLPGDGEKKYIGLEHIIQGDLQINGFGYSSSLQSNKFYFKKGDVLFGKLRPYFRKVWQANFDGVCSTDIWVIRAKEGYDQNFLFYFMANPVLINKSTGASTGTKMPRADWDFLKDTEWLFPSFPEQKAIAAILSGFDDKIELLRRQNKTLEAIARTIFKEWFVNFTINGKKLKVNSKTSLPEGWRTGKLGDIVSHIKENEIPLKNKNKLYLHYSIPAFDSGKKPVIELGEKILSNKYTVKPFSLLVSKLNPSKPRIWTVFHVEENSICSTEFQVLKPNEQNYLSFIHCFLNSECFTKEFASKAHGTSSSHQRAKPENILNMEVSIPKSDVKDNFHEIIFPLLNKVNNNNSQIQTLSKLRDTLLPKLMKGEIRVKDTEPFIKEKIK